MTETSGINWDKVKNFTQDEFMCKCGCGKAVVIPILVNKLQRLRDYVNSPIIITSGYRCPNHGAERRKTWPGAHAHGLAADIIVRDVDLRYKVIQAATVINFTGIGVAKTFIHLDVGHPRAFRPALWTYRE